MTNRIYTINGQRLKLVGADVNKDGMTDKTEEISRANIDDVVPVQRSTEMGEALSEMNKDIIDLVTRQSSIDFLSEISPHEYDAMCRLDALIALRLLPTSVLTINRSKMRKSVSLKRQGRKEFVDLVSGKQDLDEKRGNALRNFMGFKKKE